MERLGLKKRNFLNIGLDNCLRNTKYKKISLIKAKGKDSKFLNNNLSNTNFKNNDISFDILKNNNLYEKKLNKENNEIKLEDINFNMKNNESIIIEKNKSNKRTKEQKIINKKMKKQKRKKLLIIFIILFFILLMVFEIFTTVIEPSLIAMCEIRANSIGVTVSSKAVKQVMEEVGYDIQLVNLEKDNEGNIIALKANVVQMNYIASLIGSRTQQMYNELTETYVQIPIGNFTDNALLAGRGPKIRVKIMPVGTVGSDFKTEFISSGINQTRHRVYLQVISSMRVIAPFSTKTIKVINNVNVAETVLIGNVPNSYYNLEGVDNIADDSLNLWDE